MRIATRNRDTAKTLVILGIYEMVSGQQAEASDGQSET
jgi:hypothetical protein